MILFRRRTLIIAHNGRGGRRCAATRAPIFSVSIVVIHYRPRRRISSAQLACFALGMRNDSEFPGCTLFSFSVQPHREMRSFFITLVVHLLRVAGIRLQSCTRTRTRNQVFCVYDTERAEGNRRTNERIIGGGLDATLCRLQIGAFYDGTIQEKHRRERERASSFSLDCALCTQRRKGAKT